MMGGDVLVSLCAEKAGFLVLIMSFPAKENRVAVLY